MTKSLFNALGDDGNDLLDFSAYQNQPLAGNGSGGALLLGGAGDGPWGGSGHPQCRWWPRQRSCRRR